MGSFDKHLYEMGAMVARMRTGKWKTQAPKEHT